jgi:hypothetical protein
LVPAEYSTFFITMATVCATLFGLIFVAISIAPEKVNSPNGTVDRQIRATAAYIALLNPLMVSLFAIVPHQWIGIAVTVLSWVGILNTLAISVTLVKSRDEQVDRLRSIFLIVISLILYGFEAFVASQMTRMVIDTYWFSILADLLVFITLFGIVRAWEIIEIRHFRIRDWLTSLFIKVRKGGGKPKRK